LKKHYDNYQKPTFHFPKRKISETLRGFATTCLSVLVLSNAVPTLIDAPKAKSSVKVYIFAAIFGLLAIHGIRNAISVWFPTKKKPNARIGILIPLLIFSIFAAAGSYLFYYGGIITAMKLKEAEHWIKTPCTITISEIHTTKQAKKTNYNLKFRYTYTFNQKPQTSRAYQIGPNPSGRKKTTAVVKQNPPQSKRYCYVNPQSPSEAVIRRDVGPGMGLSFGIGTVLGLIGFGGMIGTFIVRRHLNNYISS